MSFLPVRNSPSESYTRLESTLLAKLPGAGIDQLRIEIANAFQAFCRDTHVWREKIERNLIANLDTYELSPSRNDARVTFVIAVQVNERYYQPLGGEAFDRSIYGGYDVLDDYKSIRLLPPPSGDSPKGLKAFVGLSLKPTSLDLPCEIIDRYFESIQDGVLERMLAHANRPYSNPAQSQLHARKFHAAMTRVRRDVRGGNAQASPPWAYPTQAPGRPQRGGRSYGW